MKIEKVKISELNPAEYNPRRMTNKQYEDLKNSLEKFGLVDPIIINSDNTVVGGHQRLRIMRELGAEYVPTVRVNLSKEDEKELNIRLNKNTGEFDLDVLANNFEVEELKDWGFKDVELGFNIDKIVEGNTEDDHIPEVKETRVKLGDVWKLGKHRLMCGDSTKKSDVKKLMNGDSINLIFTDPMYSDTFKPINEIINFTNIEHILLMSTMKQCFEVYTVSDLNFRFELVFNQKVPSSTMNKKVPYYLHKTITYWTKKNETIFNCNNAQGTFTEKGYYPSVIESGKNNQEIHALTKPVDAIIKILSGFKFETLLDLFIGSGTTLIACEKTNKICYGMEINNKYCDVIIERWEQFTGQKAEKI